MRFLDHRDLKRVGFQLACDGKWENAFALPRNDEKALLDWIIAAGEDIAIESLFSDLAGERKGFVGFRCLMDNTEARCAFWQDFVKRSLATEFDRPRDQLMAWLTKLGHASLLNTPPAAIELGVWNQWYTAGPIALRSDRLTDADLKDCPGWVRNGATAPICRERQWLAPVQFWVADVVSQEKDGLHFLDQSLLAEDLRVIGARVGNSCV